MLAVAGSSVNVKVSVRMSLVRMSLVRMSVVSGRDEVRGSVALTVLVSVELAVSESLVIWRR